MSSFHVLLVGIGGFFGAISRLWVSQFISKRFVSGFPAATLIINLMGSLLLGIMVGSGIKGSLFMLLGTGFMGAFTTFSTFKLEAIQLQFDKRKKDFILYNILGYGGGILLAFLGIELGSLFR
ncbi:chromosome condensation protein CrcB [Cytobacillus firmus]|uniref:fluoride efflux transporter CrcB n=1 Tax=Cytobacillus firmus TaxID=1399 RepID=UPI00077C2BF4|nr:fluoride efflux transporter CrcB [Cytobacillus firmus]MBG9545359.1 chromosome condensation protein CrcB [Cytobacillus firmus]MBG9554453.1 chromosome condensation protein CrcB [Cytobacillus firmus]MBG9555442.1 chromosome condensation protein CrcB [Cytobacillus firmus]MBG9577124.1 chromosome condensation protein CrcB [Cytobacillus firmus]MEC1891274.1 fluoride efflux transporter CrcB [Cytobacillus firmus]